MELLKAAKEEQQKHPALKITKMSNPVRNGCPTLTKDGIELIDSVASWAGSPKKNRRKKRTVPKQWNLEDMDTSAIQETPPNSKNIPELTNGIHSSCHEDSDGSVVSVSLFVDVDNYRRFSSRLRKKPDFFSASRGSAEESRAQPRAEEVNRRRRDPPARRALRFSLSSDGAPDPATDAPTPGETPGETLTEETVLEKLTPENISVCSDVADSKDEAFQQPMACCDEESLSVKPEPTHTDDPEEAPTTSCPSSPLASRVSPPPGALPPSTPPPSTLPPDLKEKFPVATMVWGKLPGYNWWPGSVISYEEGVQGKEGAERRESGGERERKEPTEPQVWIKWFGENNLSQISGDRLAFFANFTEFYQPTSMKGMYKKAVLAALKEAARRCKMEFLSRPDDKKPRWIITDGNPDPKLIEEKAQDTSNSTDAEKGSELEKPSPLPEKGNSPAQPTSTAPKGRGVRRGKLGRERGSVMLTALEQEVVEWALGGFQPAGSEGLEPSPETAVQIRVVPVGDPARDEESSTCHGDEEPPRKKAKVMLLEIRKKARFDSVVEGHMKLSSLCIGCADMEVVAEHPLFQGSLCKTCKDNFMESAYLFDDDGTQMYCTICSEGSEVFMCDAENCAKVYCAPCIEKLCGPAEVERVRAADSWLCYMCSPTHSEVGLLAKREDWDKKLQELFTNDHEREYDAPRSYPPVPPEERQPIRVLGLFDGIATGLLVLKDLGIQVTKYFASEVDPDAVKVSQVRHQEIIEVGDVSKITEKEIKAWGPFDLVMGGSPCNDLSIVNPARRGIYEGTGRLFFEFFRLMMYAKPSPGEDRPFFWLYENVVSMRASDKLTISRFLECNPVVVDAMDISAAHRARYFWGNLPGMNRPTTPLPGDRLTLQECLEPNCFRTAQFTKLRTITTKMNSIKQTKKSIYPVRVEGDPEKDGDVLWCTEMERLFGFPDHYTDVANLGRSGRQKLLGKAWSVPVIRHLISPLKDYFKSDTHREKESSSGGTRGH